MPGHLGDLLQQLTHHLQTSFLDMSYYDQKAFDPERPLVFQDVDGVLNSNNWNSPLIDESLVKNLVKILDKSNAQLVLSTHWRKSPNLLDKLFAAFDKYGVKAPIVDATPSLCRGVECRASEIHAWIKDHPQFKGNWVALDDWDLFDQPDGEHMVGHFVHTDPDNGLTPDDADQAIGTLLGAGREKYGLEEADHPPFPLGLGDSAVEDNEGAVAAAGGGVAAATAANMTSDQGVAPGGGPPGSDGSWNMSGQPPSFGTMPPQGFQQNTNDPYEFLSGPASEGQQIMNHGGSAPSQPPMYGGMDGAFGAPPGANQFGGYGRAGMSNGMMNNGMNGNNYLGGPGGTMQGMGNHGMQGIGNGTVQGMGNMNGMPGHMGAGNSFDMMQNNGIYGGSEAYPPVANGGAFNNFPGENSALGGLHRNALQMQQGGMGQPSGMGQFGGGPESMGQPANMGQQMYAGQQSFRVPPLTDNNAMQSVEGGNGEMMNYNNHLNSTNNGLMDGNDMNEDGYAAIREANANAAMENSNDIHAPINDDMPMLSDLGDGNVDVQAIDPVAAVGSAVAPAAAAVAVPAAAAAAQAAVAAAPAEALMDSAGVDRFDPGMMFGGNNDDVIALDNGPAADNVIALDNGPEPSGFDGMMDSSANALPDSSALDADSGGVPAMEAFPASDPSSAIVGETVTNNVESSLAAEEGAALGGDFLSAEDSAVLSNNFATEESTAGLADQMNDFGGEDNGAAETITESAAETAAETLLEAEEGLEAGLGMF